MNTQKIVQLKKRAKKLAESTRKVIAASIVGTSAATAAQLQCVSGLARAVMPNWKEIFLEGNFLIEYETGAG